MTQPGRGRGVGHSGAEIASGPDPEPVAAAATGAREWAKRAVTLAVRSEGVLVCEAPVEGLSARSVHATRVMALSC